MTHKEMRRQGLLLRVCLFSPFSSRLSSHPSSGRLSFAQSIFRERAWQAWRSIPCSGWILHPKAWTPHEDGRLLATPMSLGRALSILVLPYQTSPSSSRIQPCNWPMAPPLYRATAGLLGSSTRRPHIMVSHRPGLQLFWLTDLPAAWRRLLPLVLRCFGLPCSVQAANGIADRSCR